MMVGESGCEQGTPRGKTAAPAALGMGALGFIKRFEQRHGIFEPLAWIKVDRTLNDGLVRRGCPLDKPRVAFEWPLERPRRHSAGEYLVCDETPREDIGCLFGATVDLLGCDITQRPAVCERRVFGNTRKAEVCEPGFARGIDQDVLRFDIPMQDPVFVGVC